MYRYIYMLSSDAYPISKAKKACSDESKESCPQDFMSNRLQVREVAEDVLRAMSQSRGKTAPVCCANTRAAAIGTVITSANFFVQGRDV